MKFFFLLILPFSAAFSQPVVAKKNFHLFLLAGQSNMAGRGAVEAEDTIRDKRIWVLNKENKWKLAAEPLHFDKPAVVGVGPGFAFAKTMAAADTSIVIGLIPCAVGGSPIEMWEPGKYYEPTKSYPYDDAVRRTKRAMQYGVLKGVLWQQGESDSDSVRAELYAERLMLLIKGFRNELKIKLLPFIAGTIADFYLVTHPFAKGVNEAIRQMPQKFKYTAVANSSGLKHKGDGVHFDSNAARELGKRYAEIFQSLQSR